MKTKILFFIEGSLPTEDELEKAEKITGKVCFRNALMIGDEHKPEECDYVCGHIPECYRDFEEWEFEVRVKTNPTLKATKAPVIKPETKTQPSGWTPNA